MSTTKIRQSEFTAFMECRRRWYLRYVMGYGIPGDEERLVGSRGAGTIAHAGIEAYNVGNSAQAAALALEALRPQDENDKDAWDAFRMGNAMAHHYIEWVEEGNDVGCEYVAAEYEWETPLTAVTKVFGAIDHVYLDPFAGGYVIRDYKTVARLSDTPHDADFQLRTYAWAWWRITGEVPVASEHLMIKRVLGSGRAAKPFVQKHRIPVNERILQAHHAHMDEIAFQMSQCRLQLTADSPRIYPTTGRHCTWKCEFAEVCAGMDDGSYWEDALEANYEVLYLSDPGQSSPVN